MRRLLRVVLPGAIAVVPIAVAGYFGLRAFARSSVFAGCPDSFADAGALPPRSEIFTYPGDGLELAAALVRSEREAAPVVLYFHGNAESAAGNLGLASELAAHGVDTVLAEYRGYGGQPGAPTEEHVYADALALRRELARRGIAATRQVIVGRSLGTGVAVELASREPVPLLVLVSPYTSVVDVGRSLAGPLAPFLVPDRFDSLAKASRVGSPVTIFHGTEDRTIPIAMAERLAGTFPRARLVRLTDRGHNEIPDLAAMIAGEIARAFPGLSARGST